jgi:hypothetical protein
MMPKNQERNHFIIILTGLNSFMVVCIFESEVTMTIDGKNIAIVATIAQIIQYTL